MRDSGNRKAVEESGLSEEGISGKVTSEEMPDLEAQQLREENERLREEIARVKNLPLKERLYDHVHVSVRTLDIFIVVMLLLGLGAIIVGMIK